MAADDLNGGAVSGSSGLSGAVYVPTGFTTSALENAVAAGGTAQDYAAIGTALSSAGSAVAIAAAAVAGAVTAGTLTGSITTASDRTGSDTLTQAETIWGVNVAEASEAYETAAAAAAEEAASKAASLAESTTTWQVAGSGDSRVLLRYTTVADYGSTDGSVDAVSSAQDTSGYSRDGTSGTAAASAASEQSSSAAAGTDAAGSAAASGTGSSTGAGSGSGSGTGGSAGSGSGSGAGGSAGSGSGSGTGAGSGASGSAGSGSGSSAGGRSGSAAYYDPLNGVKYTVVYASHPAAALQSGEVQSAAGLAAGSSPFAGDYAPLTETEQTLWGGQTGTLRALDTSGDTVLWGNSGGAGAAAAEPAGLLDRVVSLLTGGEDSGDSAAFTEVLSAEYFSAGAAENTGASGVPENPVSAAPEFSDAPAGPAGAAEISGDLPGAETGAAGEFSDAALPDQPEVSGAAAFSGSGAAAGAGGAVSGLPEAYSGDLENSSAGGAPAGGGLSAGPEFPPAALSGSAAELSEFSADPENPAFSESVSAGLSDAAALSGEAGLFGSAAYTGGAPEISGLSETGALSGFPAGGGTAGLSGVLFWFSGDPEDSGFSGLSDADSDTEILPAAEAERLQRMAIGAGGPDREARASGERSRKTLRIRSSGSSDDAGTGRILSALAQSFETRLAVSGEGVHR